MQILKKFSSQSLPTSYLGVRYEEALDKQSLAKSILSVSQLNQIKPSGFKKASDLRSLAFFSFEGIS
ncbi:hypothetical protein [Tumidithrix elongata]|uniref:hypothetical protein n=1 Tax=Tumidithrix elongata TaxID=3088357 RepID=UPI002ECFEEEA